MAALGRQLPVTKGSYRPIKTLGFGRFRPVTAVRELPAGVCYPAITAGDVCKSKYRFQPHTGPLVQQGSRRLADRC